MNRRLGVAVAGWCIAPAAAAAAELLAAQPLQVALGDGAAGLSLLAAGVWAWLAGSRRLGWLLALAGTVWFAGTASLGAATWLATIALYAYRGPLTHAALADAAGRLSSTPIRVVTALAYIDGVWGTVAQRGTPSIVLAALILAAAAWRAATADPRGAWVGPAARAALLAAVIGGPAITRAATSGPDSGHVVLLTADGAVIALAIAVLAGAVSRAAHRRALLDGTIASEQAPATGLAGAIARAIGDPDIRLHWWDRGADSFVDSEGRPVALEPETSVALRAQDGQPLAVIVDRAGALADPEARASVTQAVQLSADNARLQAGLEAQVRAVQASRRRLVTAGTTQRGLLEARLSRGPLADLDDLGAAVAALRPDAADPVDSRLLLVAGQLELAAAELRTLARGLHPPALEAGGLEGALGALAADAPVPVTVDVQLEGRPSPATELAAYFCCSEALANVAKHSRATRSSVSVRARAEDLVMSIADDGVGGAREGAGSGLRGLTDRAEALGGRVALESPVGRGTTLEVVIPLDDRR